MSDLILYTSEDGRTRLELRVQEQTIWLSQLEIAELFQTTKQNVSLHAKNIFNDGELAPDSVVKESLTTAADGKNYRTQLYNLDLILAIGYRVRSRCRKARASEQLVDEMIMAHSPRGVPRASPPLQGGGRGGRAARCCRLASDIGSERHHTGMRWRQRLVGRPPQPPPCKGGECTAAKQKEGPRQ